jgi:hypothetical protein
MNNKTFFRRPEFNNTPVRWLCNELLIKAGEVFSETGSLNMNDVLNHLTQTILPEALEWENASIKTPKIHPGKTPEILILRNGLKGVVFYSTKSQSRITAYAKHYKRNVKTEYVFLISEYTKTPKFDKMVKVTIIK